jgi:hypothetical protein
MSNAPSIASRMSPMACTRCLGSFCRQRLRYPRSAGDSIAGSLVQSGSRSMTRASVSETLSPSNARVPVSISYSTQPNAQMSARRSTGLPRACSGLM